MKNLNIIKTLLFSLSICLINISSSQENQQYKEVSIKKHARNISKIEKEFRKNREKFKKTQSALYLTPDKYWEQEYIATMNPSLKRPTPEVLDKEIQNILAKQATSEISIQPGTSNTTWNLRGPNYVGGRTRALAWDPNDATGKKVWAGAVTGGLWYNNDITSSTSQWVSVSSVWSNITVSCIAFDPNNSKIIYVGTGEGWGTTNSSSRGQGIYKSTDGGSSFSLLSSSTSYMYINDIVVRNVSGTSEVWVAVDAMYYGGQWNGLSSYGLKKSTDGGSTWSGPLTSSIQLSIADIEISKRNKKTNQS